VSHLRQIMLEELRRRNYGESPLHPHSFYTDEIETHALSGVQEICLIRAHWQLLLNDGYPQWALITPTLQRCLTGKTGRTEGGGRQEC
jgi:hypothetical protein